MSYMRPFDKSNRDHLAWAATLPFSHATCVPYLEMYAQVFHRNDEPIFVWQHETYVHRVPSIFLPADKRNWEECAVACATPEAIEAVRAEGIPILKQELVSTEYFYTTKTFTEPEGTLAKKIRKFQRDFPTLLISREGTRDQLSAFYDTWLACQRPEAVPAIKQNGDRETMFAFFDRAEEHGIKSIYAYLDGRLVGFAMGVGHPSGNWVGLQLKTDRAVTGLTRFLEHERAKLFSDCPEVSLSTGCGNAGLDAFKQELGPAYTKEYSYIETGSKPKV